MATIWLSVTRDLRMGCSSPRGESLDHMEGPA